MSLGIADATSTAQLRQLRALFREYQQLLGFDLGFQDFDRELAELPGRYAPPQGCLLLASEGGEAAGCVAMRPWGSPEESAGATCEMKRLYVRPRWLGNGLGRQLAELSVARAQRAGYRRMRLDSLARLAPALELYRSMGFQPIAPYRENPLNDVVYLELDLAAWRCAGPRLRPDG